MLSSSTRSATQERPAGSRERVTVGGVPRQDRDQWRSSGPAVQRRLPLGPRAGARRRVPLEGAPRGGGPLPSLLLLGGGGLSAPPQNGALRAGPGAQLPLPPRARSLLQPPPLRRACLG